MELSQDTMMQASKGILAVFNKLINVLKNSRNHCRVGKCVRFASGPVTTVQVHPTAMPNAFVVAEQESLYLKIIKKFRHLICMTSRIKDALCSADNQSSEMTYAGCNFVYHSRFMLHPSLGFTLAEVLITLGIIGVVAAMTIPAVMNKTQDLEFKTALKKTYSMLSQAHVQIANDGGGLYADAISHCSAYSNCWADVYKKYLSFAKTCDGGSVEDICFPNHSDIKYLMGSTVSINFGLSPNADSGAVLKDGISLIFSLDNPLCNTVSNNVSNECGWITVDVNGLKKPNTWGKDIYIFFISNEKVIPNSASIGGVGGVGDDCGVGENYGQTCAAKYLFN